MSRQSTLEAAAKEIINETRSHDLSKWTGNKSLLIGPSPGWRQGGGCGFPCKEDRASWKLQVSSEALGTSPGDTWRLMAGRSVGVESSSMREAKVCCLLSCNHVSVRTGERLVQRSCLVRFGRGEGNVSAKYLELDIKVLPSVDSVV